MRKVMMVVATAVALTGALSADAFARGAPVGPMGQIFDGVNPVDHPFIFGRAGKAYGSVSRHAQRSNRGAHSAYDYRPFGSVGRDRDDPPGSEFQSQGSIDDPY
jgi:hypothetical protein